jgi:hypothetical protein
MSDAVAFAILIAAQCGISAGMSLVLLRWKPSIDQRWRVAFAALSLPALGVALLGLMMFGMGHITDLAAMAIAAIIVVTAALVPVGLLATVATLRLARWWAKG